MKVLVAGWFSYENCGATGGDLIVRDVVCSWLQDHGVSFDAALAKPFQGGVDLSEVEAEDYTHVIFVCGPYFPNELSNSFLTKFAECRVVGVNLTMIQSLDDWNPFDFLLERDSLNSSYPDLCFLADASKAPVIGVIQVGPQWEYGSRGRHSEVNEAIKRLVASREMSVVTIDTGLFGKNVGGLRSPGEIEALISKMDVVITNRLHGVVFAIKNAVPVIAIDAIQGGAKVSAQCEAIGWPIVLRAGEFNDTELQNALGFCLSHSAREKAVECRQLALQRLKPRVDEFFKWLRSES